MAAAASSLQIQPGKGLGFLTLGASLHDILTRLRSQSQIYPAISISYSQKDTLRLPVIVSLPQNGIRLRFDGPEQRLRLLEVVDFSRLSLSYKNTKSTTLVTLPGSHGFAGGKRASGPTFRQIYDIFSVTFPGEYFPPKKPSKTGTYVLSYPGLAFSFSVEHSAWQSASESDFVKVLSSPAASPARCLAIYNGGSWKEVRRGYLTEPAPHPRSLHAPTRAAADDVEMVKIKGRGRIQIQRRFTRLEIVLGRSTPQDVVAALGPPDLVYRKHDWRLAIHKRRGTSNAGRPADWNMSGTHAPPDFDELSAVTDESASDEEPAAAAAGLGPERDNDCFYNYFRHGFDLYLSDSPHLSPPLAPSRSPLVARAPAADASLVVTKLILHANVPGSHAFNRYRRCRWVLDASKLAGSAAAKKTPHLTSEARFAEIGSTLRRVWASSYASDEERRMMERPMVLNRGWTDSPSSSCELLGELDDSEVTLPSGGKNAPAAGLAASVGNTRLFGFPGLLFEVLANDAVSCLTIY